MSKLKNFLNVLYIFIIFLVSLLVISPKVVLASTGPCSFIYDPNPPNENMNDLTITIVSNSLPTGLYRYHLKKDMGGVEKVDRDIKFPDFAAKGSSVPNAVNIVLKKATVGWPADYPYFFEFFDQETNVAVCTDRFSVEEKPALNCTAELGGFPSFPDTDITLNLKGLKSGDSYDVFVDDIYKKASFTYDDKKTNELSIGKYAPSEFYRVTILNQCGPFNLACNGRPPQLQCPPKAFSVGPRGTQGGKEENPDNHSSAPGCKKDCASSGGQTTPGCNDPTVIDPSDSSKKIPNPNPGIATAIGCIHTNPAEFIKDLMKFIIGIAGGLAFLMMLLGAFQMLTSAGNPETLSAGRDRLTSAVIGLLFIIFAILLLQIIGVDILKIPGFGR